MASELIALATAIDAGNGTLPPHLAKLIQNAPESFTDDRAGKIAMSVRAMRQAGEPVSFQSIGGKHLPLLTFITAELGNAGLPPDAVEPLAKQAWQDYQTRRAATILAEAVEDLKASPAHAVPMPNTNLGAATIKAQAFPRILLKLTSGITNQPSKGCPGRSSWSVIV